MDKLTNSTIPKNDDIFSNYPSCREFNGKLSKCFVQPKSVESRGALNQKLISIFVNGSFNEERDGIENAQKLADSLGRNVLLVYNDRETSRFKEFAKVLQTKYFPSLRPKVEPAVFELSKIFKEGLLRGKKIDIHAHSQGVFLMESAISEVAEEQRFASRLAKEKWLSSNFKMTSYGAPELTSKVLTEESRKFSLDIVPLSVAPIEALVGFGKKIFVRVRNFLGGREDSSAGNESLVKGRRAIVAGTKHSFAEYLQSTPRFFLAKHRRKSPEDLVKIIQDSIKNREYSRSVYEKIFKVITNEKHFASKSDRKRFLDIIRGQGGSRVFLQHAISSRK